MDAKFIQETIRKNYCDSAFVPEVTIPDYYYQWQYFSTITSLYSVDNLNPYNEEVDELYNLDRGKFDRRIDLLMLKGQQWSAIEIKISRSDFFKDTYEKRKTWQEHTHRFIYAVPEGLIRVDEVPNGCGLWEISENGSLRVLKRAKINKDRRSFPEALFNNIFWRLHSLSH